MAKRNSFLNSKPVSPKRTPKRGKGGLQGQTKAGKEDFSEQLKSVNHGLQFEQSNSKGEVTMDDQFQSQTEQQLLSILKNSIPNSNPSRSPLAIQPRALPLTPKPAHLSTNRLADRKMKLAMLLPIWVDPLAVSGQEKSDDKRISLSPLPNIDLHTPQLKSKFKKNDSPLAKASTFRPESARDRVKKQAVEKFQRAVKKAIEINKDEEGKRNFFDLPKPDLNSQPRKSKETFFSVVRKLNPFLKKNQQAKVVEDETTLNTNRFLLEKNEEEVKEAKRKRARQLWRKAKSVFRAISIWKSIQTDIQMYGTHNYEFRSTFKLASQQTLNRKVQRRETQEIRKQQNRLLIHPDMNFKRVWSALLIVMLFYVATIMPFSIAFLDYQVGDFWYFLDIFVNTFFLIDVFVNFFSGYYDEDGRLVYKRSQIIFNYLKSWFLIDFTASIPFNLLINSSKRLSTHKINTVLRLLRIPKLYQLVQTVGSNKIVSNTKDKPTLRHRLQEFSQANSGTLKLLSFILLAFVCLHISACFWFMTANISEFSPDTWVVRNNFLDADNQTKYLASLYWAISTVLTVGYGDIHASTNLEKLLTCLWMMIGVGFYSFSIGYLTSFLAKMDSRAAQLKTKHEVIDIFSQEANLDHTLKKKIKEALEYNSKQNAFSWIEKYSIFNELPYNLKYETAMQIHSGDIGRMPFFKNKDAAFVGNVVPLLQPLRVADQEYVYFANDHPYDIYFIVRGRVNFVMDFCECIFKTWPSGSYFGEIEVIFQKHRICSARAEEHCDLFTLNKKYYQTLIFNDYPEIEVQIRDLAEERELRIMAALNKANTVLESIGIQTALDLPLRNRNRKGSGSSHNSKSQSNKRYLSNIEKVSALMKVTQSFERAHLQSQNHPKERSPDKLNNDHSSTSSGDFNIWGEKIQSGSSSSSQPQKNSHKDSFGTDRSLESPKRKDPSPSIKITPAKEDSDSEGTPQLRLNQSSSLEDVIEESKNDYESQTSIPAIRIFSDHDERLNTLDKQVSEVVAVQNNHFLTPNLNRHISPPLNFSFDTKELDQPKYRSDMSMIGEESENYSPHSHLAINQKFKHLKVLPTPSFPQNLECQIGVVSLEVKGQGVYARSQTQGVSSQIKEMGRQIQMFQTSFKQSNDDHLRMETKLASLSSQLSLLAQLVGSLATKQEATKKNSSLSGVDQSSHISQPSKGYNQFLGIQKPSTFKKAVDRKPQQSSLNQSDNDSFTLNSNNSLVQVKREDLPNERGSRMPRPFLNSPNLIVNRNANLQFGFPNMNITQDLEELERAVATENDLSDSLPYQ